jgi:predicted nucleotidyltransferase component of viral defense system
MDKEEDMWHRAAVTPEVEHTLRDLYQSSLLTPFYLAGGTGLALHLGHRRSVDLDFFSSEIFNEETLLQKIQSRREFSLVAKEPGTLHAHIGGIKVSFLAYAYPLLFPCTTFLDVNVADPRDIACMKVSAIAGRGTKRDFVDLYAAAQHYGLRQILEWFKQKFELANYNSVHIVKSLTYFDDAEKDPAPDMLVPISWQEVRVFFTRDAPHLL